MGNLPLDGQRTVDVRSPYDRRTVDVRSSLGKQSISGETNVDMQNALLHISYTHAQVLYFLSDDRTSTVRRPYVDRLNYDKDSAAKFNSKFESRTLFTLTQCEKGSFSN